MATPSVQAQINMCISSVLALKNLSESIDIARQQVNSMVTVLQANAFKEHLKEIELLKEYYTTASAYTQDFIATAHIKYLDTQIQNLADSLPGAQQPTNNR